MFAPESQSELRLDLQLPVPSKVITRVFGGLGNQLFCYAAARRLAIVNDAQLVIDDVSGFVSDRDYRRQYQLDHFRIPCRKATPAERMEPFARMRRYVKRSLNRLRPFETRRYIQQDGVDFDSRLLAVKPHGTLYLEGYWQSEQYFKDFEPLLRKELCIIAPEDEANQSISARIRSTHAVAVHVRFFEAQQVSNGSNVAADYYARAVAMLDALIPAAHFYIFSDRPEAARSWIRLPDQRVTLVSHNSGDENAYADLWLMSQCQHFIIANSTFSWWGAWLSSHDEKIIIAPGTESRAGVAWWGFDGLLPDDWIKL